MRNPDKSSQQGVVLLETLIAILIFSFGMLGLIGLQANTAKIALDARFRTEAAALADDLIAQMMVSDPATLVADFQSISSAAKYQAWYTTRVKLDPAASPTGILPNGQATVTFDTTGGGAPVVYVEIKWAAPGQAQSTHVTYAAISS